MTVRSKFTYHENPTARRPPYWISKNVNISGTDYGQSMQHGFQPTCSRERYRRLQLLVRVHKFINWLIMVKGRRQIYPMKTNALKVASVCQSKKIPEEKHRTAAVCFRGVGNVVITDIDIIGIVSYRIGALHIVFSICGSIYRKLR